MSPGRDLGLRVGRSDTAFTYCAPDVIPTTVRFTDQIAAGRWLPLLNSRCSFEQQTQRRWLPTLE
jgi:hypothetical protein